MYRISSEVDMFLKLLVGAIVLAGVVVEIVVEQAQEKRRKGK